MDEKGFCICSHSFTQKKKILFAEIIEDHHSYPFDDVNIIDKLSENELHSLIKKMPEGYRTVFNLVVIESYSHEEVAALLNIKATTSRTQLLKARKMLQSLISKCFNMVII